MKPVAEDERPLPPTLSDAGADLFELLRYSHIFASVVREILELKLLREISSEPLTLSQFHLLKLISLNGHHQVGEVADFLGVTPPAATKNVDKLERLGLVVRRPSEGDRRATLLGSSARGRRLVERYERLKAERLTPVVEAFEPDELRLLSDLLERFSVVLLAAESRAGEGDSGICLRCSAYYEEKCSIPHVQDGCPYQKVRASRQGTDRRADAM